MSLNNDYQKLEPGNEIRLLRLMALLLEWARCCDFIVTILRTPQQK
jgi:hypothetical protein